MYTIKNKPSIVSSSLSSSFLILKDTHRWEEFSEADLEKHFNAIHAMFLERVRELDNPLYAMTASDEKELQFIFDVLLQAKTSLQDSR